MRSVEGASHLYNSQMFCGRDEAGRGRRLKGGDGCADQVDAAIRESTDTSAYSSVFAVRKKAAKEPD